MEEKEHVTKKVVLEELIFFYCIIVGIFIMIFDGLFRLLKKLGLLLFFSKVDEEEESYRLYRESEREQYRLNKQIEKAMIKEAKKEKEQRTIIKEAKEEPHRREHKSSFKKPFFFRPQASFAYITISVVLICGCMYAFFSDKAVAEVSLQAGTLLVKLDEAAPFDDLGSIPEEGANTNEKSFRAVSICTIDTYVRARIIPVIEQYDEEEEGYVVIPIDVNDVILSVNTEYWIYSDGYYYYKEVLNAGTSSEYLDVIVARIKNAGDYEDVDVRLTLRVELEAAQVHNDLWKRIFNIESLPF